MSKNTSTKTVQKGKAGAFLRRGSVPLMFIVICAFCIPMSGLSPSYLINEIVTRMGRNAFLILSLLIPIMAGMGLNFGMTLGAMAGQIGLILVSDWQIVGIPGMVLAMIISVPISILLGLFCGKILNMARGREMITSYIISFSPTVYTSWWFCILWDPLSPLSTALLSCPEATVSETRSVF